MSMKVTIAPPPKSFSARGSGGATHVVDGQFSSLVRKGQVVVKRDPRVFDPGSKRDKMLAKLSSTAAISSAAKAAEAAKNLGGVISATSAADVPLSPAKALAERVANVKSRIREEQTGLGLQSGQRLSSTHSKKKRSSLALEAAEKEDDDAFYYLLNEEAITAEVEVHEKTQQQQQQQKAVASSSTVSPARQQNQNRPKMVADDVADAEAAAAAASIARTRAKLEATGYSVFQSEADVERDHDDLVDDGMRGAMCSSPRLANVAKEKIQQMHRVRAGENFIRHTQEVITPRGFADAMDGGDDVEDEAELLLGGLMAVPSSVVASGGSMGVAGTASNNNTKPKRASSARHYPNRHHHHGDASGDAGVQQQAAAPFSTSTPRFHSGVPAAHQPPPVGRYNLRFTVIDAESHAPVFNHGVKCGQQMQLPSPRGRTGSGQQQKHRAMSARGPPTKPHPPHPPATLQSSWSAQQQPSQLYRWTAGSCTVGQSAALTTSATMGETSRPMTARDRTRMRLEAEELARAAAAASGGGAGGGAGKGGKGGSWAFKSSTPQLEDSTRHSPCCVDMYAGPNCGAHGNENAVGRRVKQGVPFEQQTPRKPPSEQQAHSSAPPAVLTYLPTGNDYQTKAKLSLSFEKQTLRKPLQAVLAGSAGTTSGGGGAHNRGDVEGEVCNSLDYLPVPDKPSQPSPRLVLPFSGQPSRKELHSAPPGAAGRSSATSQQLGFSDNSALDHAKAFSDAHRIRDIDISKLTPRPPQHSKSVCKADMYADANPDVSSPRVPEMDFDRCGSHSDKFSFGNVADLRKKNDMCSEIGTYSIDATRRKVIRDIRIEQLSPRKDDTKRSLARDRNPGEPVPDVDPELLQHRIKGDPHVADQVTRKQREKIKAAAPTRLSDAFYDVPANVMYNGNSNTKLHGQVAFDKMTRRDQTLGGRSQVEVAPSDTPGPGAYLGLA